MRLMRLAPMIAAATVAALLAGCGRRGAVPAGGSGDGGTRRGGGAVDCVVPASATPWVVIIGDVVTASVLGSTAILRDQVPCDDGVIVLPPPPPCPNVLPDATAIAGRVDGGLDEARLRCWRVAHPTLRSSLP